MSILVDGVELPNPVTYYTVQGEDMDVEFEFQKLTDDSNPDLTGATLEVTYAKERRKPALGTLTEISNDPANATWKRRLSAADSAALSMNRNGSVTSFVYTVKITYQDGSIDKPTWGYINVTPAIGA